MSAFTRPDHLVAQICRQQFHPLLQGYFYRLFRFRFLKVWRNDNIGYDTDHTVPWSDVLMSEDRAHDYAQEKGPTVPVPYNVSPIFPVNDPDVNPTQALIEWWLADVLMDADMIVRFVNELIERLGGTHKEEAKTSWEQVATALEFQNVSKDNPWLDPHGMKLKRILKTSGYLDILHSNIGNVAPLVKVSGDVFRFMDSAIFDKLGSTEEGMQNEWTRESLSDLKASITRSGIRPGGMQHFATMEDIGGRVSKDVFDLASDHFNKSIDSHTVLNLLDHVRKQYTVDLLLGEARQEMHLTGYNLDNWKQYVSAQHQVAAQQPVAEKPQPMEVAEERATGAKEVVKQKKVTFEPQAAPKPKWDPFLLAALVSAAVFVIAVN